MPKVRLIFFGRVVGDKVSEHFEEEKNALFPYDTLQISSSSKGIAMPKVL